MAIQRWHLNELGEFNEKADGDFMPYDDHVTAIASLLAAAAGALDALVTTDRTAAYDYDTPNQRLNSFYTLIYGKNTRAIKQLRAAIKKAKGE